MYWGAFAMLALSLAGVALVWVALWATHTSATPASERASIAKAPQYIRHPRKRWVVQGRGTSASLEHPPQWGDHSRLPLSGEPFWWGPSVCLPESGHKSGQACAWVGRTPRLTIKVGATAGGCASLRATRDEPAGGVDLQGGGGTVPGLPDGPGGRPGSVRRSRRPGRASVPGCIGPRTVWPGRPRSSSW